MRCVFANSASITVFTTVSVAILLSAAAATQAEVINLRSGQVGGVPGLAGQSDDIVRYLTNNPPGAAISATPFTPGQFLGAATGPAATVINAHPAWTPGISDPAARWINFGADLTLDPISGTMIGTGYGLPGSALYAVPFFVTTAGAVGGFMNLEFAVDDSGGDLFFGGGNPDFLYVNGAGAWATLLGNFGAPTTHSQFIPFTQGLNYIYLYQRDAGVLVSGTIFSITIDVVVPTPGGAALLGLGSLLAFRRRR